MAMPITQYDEQQVKDAKARLSPALQYLLVTQFSVPDQWIAELVSEGFAVEAMWPQLGRERHEVIESLKFVLGLNWEV